MTGVGSAVTALGGDASVSPLGHHQNLSSQDPWSSKTGSFMRTGPGTAVSGSVAQLPTVCSVGHDVPEQFAHPDEIVVHSGGDGGRQLGNLRVHPSCVKWTPGPVDPTSGLGAGSNRYDRKPGWTFRPGSRSARRRPRRRETRTGWPHTAPGLPRSVRRRAPRRRSPST